MKYSNMDFTEEIMHLEAESHYSTEADQIEAIEKVVASLLKKRAEFLRKSGELQGEGFFPKYYVFNNLNQHPDDDCFVLDPKFSEADVEAIEFYAEFTDNKELSRCLREWVYAHKNLTCKFPLRECCEIVGYNLCCGHCPNKDMCFIEGNKSLCNHVANDMFTSIEECENQ